MYQPNEQQRGLFADVENTANLMLWLVHFWSTVLEVFLHSGMGHRYLRINVIGGAALIPLFSCYCPPQEVVYLVMLWYAFLFMVVVRRIEASSSDRRCHSQYSGFPWLMRFTWCKNEVRFKGLWEPLLVLVVGSLVSAISVPLGSFLSWGAFCMFIKVSVINAHNEVQLKNAEDALIEQEIFAEELKSRLRR